MDSARGRVGGGAVTWGSGTAGVKGAVSAANSLVGSTAEDLIGWGGLFTYGVMALTSPATGPPSQPGNERWADQRRR